MIGTDIIDKRRIATQWEKYGLQFARRVLHAHELQQLAHVNDKIRFLATRWAAKEAFSKALGTGLRDPVLMPQIEIKHNQIGTPLFVFSPEIERLLNNKKAHLTISDERNYAVAFVLLQ